MKRYISLLLVAIMILGNFTSDMVYAISNYNNEVEVLNDIEINTNEEATDEETTDEEDKEVEREKTDSSENEEVELVEITDSEDKDVDIDNFSTEETVDMPSTYSNNYPITTIYNGKENKADRLAAVLASIDKNNVTGTITIRFDCDYKLTSEDVKFMKTAFTNDRLIFTAKPGVTVTIEHDLELYHDDMNYQPTHNSGKIITFQNIKLNFTGEHSIFANGTWLHMGKGVEMVGSHYPKIFMGSNKAGREINYSTQLRLYIESGTYSEISGSSGVNGRLITTYGSLYLHGGYIKKIVAGENDRHRGTLFVKVFSGEIDEVIDKKTNTSFNTDINLHIGNTITIKKIETSSSVTIGFNETINGTSKFFPGKLIVTDSMKISSLGLANNAVIELAQKVPTVKLNGFWYEENCTLRLPGNRGKHDVALELSSGGAFNNYSKPINFELSTDISKQEFYLIKVNNTYGDMNTGRDKYKVSENEYFYLQDAETEEDLANFKKYVFLKGKAKERGPLIYNSDSNKFSYIDRKGNENEAWWIEDKIKKNQLDFNNLNYNNLAEAEHYYVLAPSEITLKITGKGSNRTLKFDNNRYSNRPINVEFEDLDATNSEFVFKNINSIKVTGKNSITQEANKKALTYSFAGNSTKRLTLNTDDSSFVVYDNDNTNKYNIRDNIICEGDKGSTSIVKMSFEENVSTANDFKLEPIKSNSNSSLKPRKFSTKVGYDKLTLLLPNEGSDYLLKDENSLMTDFPYYFQTTIPANGNNESGKVGTKLTFASSNGVQSYYKINKKPRVQVIVNKTNNSNIYYLENDLEYVMKHRIDYNDSTNHEVVFLGDYEITERDADAIKNYSKGTTHGIIFKTDTDGWMYVLNVDRDIELMKDSLGNLFHVTFDDIKFNYKSEGKWIYANGRGLKFGDNVKMNGSYYPSVSAGQKLSSKNGKVNNANITINSGTYKEVTGDLCNSVQNATVTINDGIFEGKVSGLASKSSNMTSSAPETDRINHVTLIINNGTFKSDVYGISTKGNVNGKLTMTINRGIFNGIVVAVDGRVNENSTVTINSGTFESDVYGTKSSSNVERGLNITINNGEFKKTVIGFNGGTVNNPTLIVNNGNFSDALFGMDTNNTTGSSSTTLVGNFNMRITTGTFKKQVYAVRSGSSGTETINFEVAGGRFEDNVIGTGTKIHTLNMTISGGDFVTQHKYVVGNSITDENHKTENITLEISGGTFAWDVYGAVRAKNITMNISGGTFNTQVANQHVDNVIMNISNGTFNNIVTGNKTTSQTNVTMNITNGDFKDAIYGSVGTGDTEINVSGGTFANWILGNNDDETNDVTVNIKGNVTIPGIGKYDKLVVGSTNKPTLTITEKLEVVGSSDFELVIENESTVKLTGNQQNRVKKLTINGDRNTLLLKTDTNVIPLIVEGDYNINNNQKLKLNLEGLSTNNLANDKEIIKFEKVKADVKNFDFIHNDYYIREINSGSGNIITLCKKLEANKLYFRLNLNSSTLEYSLDGGNFNTVWWYRPDLRDSNITFTKDNLLSYKGINLFKNFDSIANGDKVFEITNNANNKTISFDLGPGTNFDFKLHNVNLNNSRLDIKNLNDLIISGNNIIYEKLSDTEPVISYQISGQVKTTDDASKLIVYTDKNNEGIKASGDKGHGVKIIFDEPFTSQESLNLKNNNINIALDMKNNYQKASLLLSQNYATGRYSLIDNSNQDKVYYFEESNNNNNVAYEIAMDNTGKTYNVTNKPFIEIKEGNNFVTIKKNMVDAINSIDSDNNRISRDYTLTFINNYELKQSDLDKWKSWNNEVGSMKITTNYKPISKKYTLTIDSDLVLPNLEYKTTFEDVKLKFTNPDTWIYANGVDLVLGTGIDIEGQNYPSVSAGRPSTHITNKIENAKLTIKSGTFKNVIGDGHNSVQNTTVTINGGTFESDVYGISTGSNASGKLTMTITDGTFNGIVVAVDGSVIEDSSLTISGGTFASYVYGTRKESNVEKKLNITIEKGTFNNSVIVLNGGTVQDASLLVKNGDFKQYLLGASEDKNTVNCSSSGSATNLKGKLDITIEDGTFINEVYGANSGLPETANIDFNISGGNFKSNVFGTKPKIDTLNMTIRGGNFVNAVAGNNINNENNKTTRINLNIYQGKFGWDVYGAVRAEHVNMNIYGGIFNTQVANHHVDNVTMKIFNGTFNDIVTGTKVQNQNTKVIMNIIDGNFTKRIYGSVGTGTTEINVSGGTFNDWIVGNGNPNKVTVNINNTITVPRIENYDKLVVGERGTARLEITQKMEINPNKENEIVIKNGSEVKLTGNDQSKVNKLTSEGPGNILTLHMDKDTAPLEVMSNYDNSKTGQLTLEAIGVKGDNKPLIKFSSVEADVNDFKITDTDYYIREIDNVSGRGNTITLCKKMTRNKLKFKLDPNTSAPSLKYSIDDKPFEKVWWYEDNNLASSNIEFTEDNLFKYKNMDIFKDVTSIPNEKVFEIINTGSNKDITVDLGTNSNFDFKLNNANLTNSKLDIKNIKDLIISGNNSISGSSTNGDPVFSYGISGQVQTKDNNSYLKIFTNKATSPFDGNVGGAIDFKFYKPFNSNSQSTSNTVRLVDSNTKHSLKFDIPNNTERLGILLGNSNSSKTYNLYHGDSGDTGTSVYVAGNTEQTFKESFDTNSSYEYVRRAKPVNRVNINVPKNVSFNVNVPEDQLDIIKPNNWNQYFIATDLEVKNDSLRVKDEFIDEKGVTHHFGKINSDLELGYLGVNSSNTTKNGIELVSNTQLDPVITNSLSGVKLALKLLNGNDEIPLDESVVLATPSKTWTILANSSETLKIEPDFNSNNNFFNISASSPRILDSKHNLKFRFNVSTP